MKKISSILMLVLLTVSTFGNVIAQSDDSGIGIDLKRVDNKAEVGLFEDLADAVGVMFTFNKEKKIERILARADKRLYEINLYSKSNPKKLARSQKAYNRFIKDVDTTLEGLGKSERDSERILEVYEGVEKMLEFHHLKAEEIEVEESRELRISQLEKIPMRAIATLGNIEPTDLTATSEDWVIADEDDRDLSFIRSLIWRIKNSDMDPRSKYFLLKRIRNYLAERTSQDDDDRDLSFLRNLIERIKNSDMDREDKIAMYKRIRNYLASQGSDSSGDVCSKDLSFIRTIIERIKNSDMSEDEKNILYKRIRNFLDLYVDECSEDDGSQSNTFFEDLIERIKNSDMSEDEKADMYQRIRNFLNANHNDEESDENFGEGFNPSKKGILVYPSYSDEDFEDEDFDEDFEDEDFEGDYKSLKSDRFDRDSVKKFTYKFGKK